MKIRIMKWLIVVLLVTSSNCYANKALTQIHSLRIWPAPENTRIVFDVSRQPVYSIKTLTVPDRIIVEFKNSQLNSKLIKDLRNNHRNGNIKKISTSINHDIVKVIFELQDKTIINSFTLKPNEIYLHRLVIDLESLEKQKILALFDLDDLSKINDHQTLIKSKALKKLPAIENPSSDVEHKSLKNLVIAIDPGHGGEDPGAIGPRGTLEKDIVLAIAKKLKDAININPKMRAFLIRNGDYYVSLQERLFRARSHHADLLLSIHADAFSNSTADGASVFVLSAKGASSAAARWLADSQNRSDTIGGVKIKNKQDMLASVLFDLSQTANYSSSLIAAKSILDAMGKSMPLHKSQVEHASFWVLKAPDVPSVLIETGFISNPKTEIKLKDHHYQHRIVTSIIQGIDRYFKLQPSRVF